MTTRSLDPYRARLSDALRRISCGRESLSTLFPRSEAVDSPIVDGEPQIVRDLEFLAHEFEALVELVYRKATAREGIVIEFPVASAGI
jgi:hypothetical protein